MFGLMRPEKVCHSKTNENYRHHRMHYCGTCKTLGLEFGQKARTLLNFDTVFFAELLSQIGDENLEKWKTAYQAVNQCFIMPEKDDATPSSLQFAATANVLLAELKLDDNLKDSKNLGWFMAQKVYSSSFQKAKNKLEKWGIETIFFWQKIEKQASLEKSKKSDFQNLEEALNYYAEPTAQMTGYLFFEGAKFVGCPDLAEKMFEFGYQFGKLIYSLDAFEDVEKDLKKGQFNPLILFYKTSQNLSNFQFQNVQKLLLNQQNSLIEKLQQLPINELVIENYAARLVSNLTLRVYKDRTPERTFTDLLKLTENKTKEAIENIILSTAAQLRTANYYLVSFVFLIFPLAVRVGVVEDSWSIYKWLGITTAVLGTAALGRKTGKKKNRRKALRFLQKMQRKAKRWMKRLHKIAEGKGDCWEDCLAACCSACCFACFQEMCNTVCDEMCYAIEENKIWPWLVLFGIGAGIAVAIIFL